MDNSFGGSWVKAHVGWVSLGLLTHGSQARRVVERQQSQAGGVDVWVNLPKPPIWVWVKIQHQGTTGFRPGFHLPGQPHSHIFVILAGCIGVLVIFQAQQTSFCMRVANTQYVTCSQCDRRSASTIVQCGMLGNLFCRIHYFQVVPKERSLF